MSYPTHQLLVVVSILVPKGRGVSSYPITTMFGILNGSLARLDVSCSRPACGPYWDLQENRLVFI
jgi:hypothetical protein